MKLISKFIISSFIFLSPLSLFSIDKVIGENKFETLVLSEPTEELKNAKVKLYIDGAFMIIHSSGVTSGEADRLPEDALKKLNYYSEERVKYASLQNLSEKERREEIARTNEMTEKLFERLDSLSEATRKKIEEGEVQFESGQDIDSYLYNEFRRNPEKEFFRDWIKDRFGTPDYSGKSEWKHTDYLRGTYFTVEYGEWAYFNVLKNKDTGKYTEDIRFSFRTDDVFYNYSGPDWVLDSDRYKSLKQSFEIMHKIMTNRKDD